MNEKKRRDITLGEMQDECKKRNAYCGDMGICPYRDFCHETVGDKCGWGDKGPREWKLSEPPRFNEAQMAFWRGWYEIGARRAEARNGTPVTYLNGENDIQLGVCVIGDIAKSITRNGETRLDLAELLGKDNK